MADKELDLVKSVLFKLYLNLSKTFTITDTVLRQLFGHNLIDQPNNSAISSLIANGKDSDAFQKWYDFAHNFYDAKQLKKFCDCLRGLAGSSSAMTSLTHVADMVEKEMASVGILPLDGEPKGNPPQVY